ncbi:glycoside hydrolase family 65 protein [Halothermothrix orenii]|uniref:Kojibiose phosphorylase n=1 Tax=Halothermothrix orenii (strain H 168 / OCM 544 / DSM 9562) TaxID=373903 RepID=B8CZX6_HALOH|nr:glycosyl hydrolase family 65 protein [Halothermothrix orenii]ACL70828.1 Kojibiose phosphorylase [Halothermothrix orenii H 168]
MELKNNLYTETGWEIFEREYEDEQMVTTGSNYLIGNGYLGYRGTFADWTANEYVACIVTDTYDMADGKWRELCNAPNGLYTRLEVDGERVTINKGEISNYRRGLNLREGLYSEEFTWKGNKGNKVHIETARFASYHNLHLIPFRYSFTVEKEAEITLVTGIDGVVWSLNGEHFKKYDLKKIDKYLAIETVTGERGIQLDVVEGYRLDGATPRFEKIIKEDRKILRELKFKLSPGTRVVLEKVISIYSSNDIKNPLDQAQKDLEKALQSTFTELREKNRANWINFWNRTDIKIKGDLKGQTALRFNLYHNRIATPAHSDRLPIGARGLSCQAYQGAAFWDQEIFNMPMFLYTSPETACNILKYRYHTLDGARKKARKLGYRGAFYAWVSGKTGEELCPSYFFKDVISGRKIHNHFNDWQIHISPDIAYAIWHYFQVTGDWNFIVNYGAEMIFEISRFLYSHAYFKKDKNRFEFIRLLGPDEYHENVDNNAFTNYQAKYTLERALDIYNKMKDENKKELEYLMEKIELTEKEIEDWKEMAELIYLPQPDEETLLIEQFDGYFDLEDTRPDELEKRLLDPGEYWGWPNGVAVETQVTKQADVIQLFCLHNIFSKGVMKANYDYYEPRTQHGSSLSPSAYSIIASQIGYVEEAYSYFIKSCTIDLYNTNKAVSGGTFIGGIHTAACGAAWQMVVFGFAGLKIDNDNLSFNPVLPSKWDEINFPLQYKNNRFNVVITKSQLKVKSSEENKETQKIRYKDDLTEIRPGDEVIIPF